MKRSKHWNLVCQLKDMPCMLGKLFYTPQIVRSRKNDSFFYALTKSLTKNYTCISIANIRVRSISSIVRVHVLHKAMATLRFSTFGYEPYEVLEIAKSAFLEAFRYSICAGECCQSRVPGTFIKIIFFCRFKNVIQHPGVSAGFAVILSPYCKNGHGFQFICSSTSPVCTRFPFHNARFHF